MPGVAVMRLAALLASTLLLSGTGLASEPADDDVEKRLLELRRTWQDEELPLEALTIDPDRKRPRSVSREEAAEDVERLFYLLSHGWSGYAFFDVEGSFDRGKERILEALRSRPEWGPAIKILEKAPELTTSKLVYSEPAFNMDVFLWTHRPVLNSAMTYKINQDWVYDQYPTRSKIVLGIWSGGVAALIYNGIRNW